jgi:hypothetical protein
MTIVSTEANNSGLAYTLSEGLTIEYPGLRFVEAPVLAFTCAPWKEGERDTNAPKSGKTLTGEVAAAGE